MGDYRCTGASAPPPDSVREQLERILGSRVFAGSDQLKRLLHLIVVRTLDGHADLLKEYNLGLEVFQRPPDYDPKLDPIVRVQARRLRAKLDEYYASEGGGDSVVIQVPKGAYVPVFQVRDSQTAGVEAAVIAGEGRRFRLSWPPMLIAVLPLLLIAAFFLKQRFVVPVDIDRSVAVLPLQMFTEDAGRAYVANQVAEVLTTELAKSEQLRVLSRTTASKYGGTRSSLPEIARELEVRWVVEGGVGIEGNRASIKLRLVDSLTDRKVWADVFDCDLHELVNVNTRAAGAIAAAIAAELRKSQHGSAGRNRAHLRATARLPGARFYT